MSFLLTLEIKTPHHESLKKIALDLLSKPLPLHGTRQSGKDCPGSYSYWSITVESDLKDRIAQLRREADGLEAQLSAQQR